MWISERKQIIKNIKKNLLDLKKTDILKRHYYTNRNQLKEYLDNKTKIIINCSELLRKLDVHDSEKAKLTMELLQYYRGKEFE